MDTLEEFEAAGLTIKIVPDHDPQNPRQWATTATLALKNEHWADDDAVSAGSEKEFYCRLASRVDEDFQMKAEDELYDSAAPSVGLYDRRVPDELVEEAIEVAHEHFYITPVYCYRHGNIALSTSPFRSSWDSGQAGFAYIAKEDAHATDEKSEEEWAHDIMSSEVDVFGKYLNGECYGYIVQDDGEHVDSCFGYFDLKYCKEEAKRSAKAVPA